MWMEGMMERIRVKSDQQKTLLDTAKSLRIAMADKRHSLDSQDKEIFRKCLDTLQSSISVRSASGMLEKLETIARQMNLKCIQNSQPPSIIHLFIMSEPFYVDIVVDGVGSVMGVNIHHQGKGLGNGNSGTIQSCPEVVECLNKQDFDAFVKHLEGLNKVYDLNCALQDKSSGRQVLCNLEDDLMRLYKVQQSQPWVKHLNQLIHKTGLGLVEGRAGGLPMKLRIFLPPYQLLDVETRRMLPMTQSTIISKDLGVTLTVGIKSSTTEHILPLTQAISSSGQDVPLGNANCARLPAYLVLELSQPLPTTSAIIKKIESITSIPWIQPGSDSSLFSLISLQESNGTLDSRNNRGMFVTLPDQQHCYYLTDTPEMVGQTITFVPFRHPSQVPGIVDLLRRQALFNCLISSCIRKNSLEDVDSSTMFEISCVDSNCQNLTIMFEDPVDEDMATAEIMLSDVTSPQCTVHLSGFAQSGDLGIKAEGGMKAEGGVKAEADAAISRVLLQSLSIPVTMRSILKKNQAITRSIKSEEDGGGLGGEAGDMEDTAGGQGGSGRGEGGEEGDEEEGRGEDGGKLKTENGRVQNQAKSCELGGPGGGKLKQEPMDTESSNDTESLNRFGPQGVESLPGALSITRSPTKVQFRQPLQASHNLTSVSKRRKSDGLVVELKEGGSSLSLSKDLEKIPSGISISKLSSSEPKPRKSSKDDGILPFVSITPISSRDSQEHRIHGKKENGGIEIIPLGGSSGSGNSSKLSHLKSKVRDFKRSLSEDDKRRIERKEKRRREEMKHRASVSPSKMKEEERNLIKGSENKHKDPKAKLAGVIERLAYQTGDAVGIEIRPSPSIQEKKISSLKLTFKNMDGSTSSSRYDGSSSGSMFKL
ncbi:mediator of RNA polymerase II transcription subunit 1 isoform X2 [Eurytemora carolleeae]|uniref:mediator of RNA polymerase II transcription subunit 1 isoform X2 n=1 Tax=Eurytemora carolleeae TaxID=1294199 RepID=UPI000C75ACF4|nr:mediator of RNA polymerase II transcription subunit 1 isoform X2 [Eurytemora carolleeae]|eukprot:XP_023337527.1 mediator of RNA polymerase II transcription subunit 1-like isoform X2 [Eurytemora affinis]